MFCAALFQSQVYWHEAPQGAHSGVKTYVFVEETLVVFCHHFRFPFASSCRMDLTGRYCCDNRHVVSREIRRALFCLRMIGTVVAYFHASLRPQCWGEFALTCKASTIKSLTSGRSA